MEVRVENVIINVDKQGTETDLSFIRGMGCLVAHYFKTNKETKTTMVALLAMMSMNLIQWSIRQRQGEKGKEGLR